VDNLQPDFLYEHIQPVRADLMQALWRTVHNPTDQVAHVAFRWVLPFRFMYLQGSVFIGCKDLYAMLKKT
jgi:hypothetical protein